MTDAAPFVSVIVPVYNGAGQIGRLLDSLRRQDYPPDRVEFIIVDDCSGDATAALVRAAAPRFALARQAVNRGSYAARNAGLARARGEVLVFTDADCEPEPDWLSAGVQALRRQGGGLVAGAVVIAPIARDSAVQRFDEAFGIQQKYFATRLRFGATANLFVARDALARVPAFDERLRSGGDRKFCQDCVAAGLAFGYCDASRVRHAPRTTFGELVVKQIRISTGHVDIFPLWARMQVKLLSAAAPESFDYQRFRRRETAAFKLRFRLVYYALEHLHVLVYGWRCLGKWLGRRLRRPQRG